MHVSCASARDDVCVGSSSSELNKLGTIDKFMNEALFKEECIKLHNMLLDGFILYTHGKLSPICF